MSEVYTKTGVQVVPCTFQVPRSKQNSKFRVINLSNGFKAVLICDIDTDSTTVSLTVNSGSNQNNGIKGLAHLVEHMIFAGSKQFPEPYHMMGVTFGAGGTVNASTTHDQTNHHFEVPLSSNSIGDLSPKTKSDEPILDYIMKVFSSMFKNPLFNSNLIKDEINEVNEEHVANMGSHDKWVYQGLKLLSNPAHSFYDFATGNNESLGTEKKLRNKLLHYFEENYGPQNMTMVIKSPLSLYYLQRLVSLNFGDIPTRERKVYTPPSLFKEHTNKLIYINNEDPTSSKARFMFPVTQLNDMAIQLVRFWIELLGQENPGSLCDDLIKCNLASAVTVFDQMIDTNNLVLIIETQLTKKGKSSVGILAAKIFSFLGTFLNCEIHDISQQYNEFIRIETLRFVYRDPDDDGLDEVTRLCENLRYCAPSFMVYGYKPVEVSARNIITETKKWLCVRNMNIILLSTSPPREPFICFDTIVLLDKYYKFEYQMCLIDPEVLTNRVSIDSQTKYIPWTSNKFFSFTKEQLETLSVTYDESSQNNFSVRITNPEPPILIENNNNFELWLKQEHDFNSKVFTSFQIISKTLPKDCFTYVSIELICEVLKEYIKTNLYPSESLGFSWSIYSVLNGTNSICFNLNGLKSNYNTVLQEFITTLIHFMNLLDKVSYTMFRKARVHLRKHHESLNNENAFTKCIAMNIYLMEENVFTIEERCEMLESLTVESIGKLARQLIDGSYTNIFVHGHTDLDTTYTISTTINRLTKHLQPNELVQPKEPSSYTPIIGKFRICLDHFETNNFCYYHVHLGERDDVYARTFGRVIEAMVAKNAYKLKSEKNIGYRVSTGLRVFRKTIGLFIYTESSDIGYKDLSDHIEDFLTSLYQQVCEMSQPKFAAIILQPCIDTIDVAGAFSPSYLFDMTPSQCSTNFDTAGRYYSRHKSYWEKIVSRSYRFGGMNGYEQVDLSLLKRATVKEISHYFEKRIISGSTRAVVTITSESEEIKPGKKGVRKLFKKQRESDITERTIDVKKYHDNCSVLSGV